MKFGNFLVALVLAVGVLIGSTTPADATIIWGDCGGIITSITPDEVESRTGDVVVFYDQDRTNTWYTGTVTSETMLQIDLADVSVTTAPPPPPPCGQ